MPIRSHAPSSAPTPDVSPPTPEQDTPGVSNQAVQDALDSGQDPQDVILYLTLNNTTHRQDEIPEVMSALKQAEHEGLGHREVLPISDPYWSKDGEGNLSFDEGTYDGVFGAEAADRVEWWHGDDDLGEGHVRIGGDELYLGTQGVWGEEGEQAAVANWKRTVMTLGLDETTADAVVAALFSYEDGSFRELDSGDGATNELVQFVVAMDKAERGEMDVRTIVFSGHHWDEDNRPGEGQGIWGEVPGGDHDYDNYSDYFSLEDVAKLKDVFPNAYAGVKSVQLAACNTDSLGMTDAEGNELTTNQFLQDTFENLELSSYWKETLAPIAANGAETNGEFVLDAMRTEGDRSDAAARDSRHNDAGLKRSLPGADGELAEIRMSTASSSYTSTADGLGAGARNDGFRDTNTDYTDREDLADYLFTATSGADQTVAGGE